jgi:predicted ribosomally synthesized peptide with nif11-like leader
MNENLVLFLKRVSEDAELAAKLRETRNPDEAYALAASVQGGFTKEEFVQTMTQLNNQVLSDADLAAISGGTDDVEVSVLGSLWSAAVTELAAFGAAI